MQAVLEGRCDEVGEECASAQAIASGLSAEEQTVLRDAAPLLRRLAES